MAHPPGRWALVLGCLIPVFLPVSGLRAQTATGLRFVQEPTDVAVGEPIDPAVTVEAVDAAGNRVASFTSRINVALLSNPGGASLGGRKQDDPVNGLATFDNLSVNEAGEGYTLRATANGLASATSAAFDVGDEDDDDDDAVRLEFGQQPADAPAGATISPAVTVRAVDSDGETDTSFGGSITIAKVSGPSSGLLQGTLTRPAASGVATFDDLSLEVTGSYTLGAASSPLAGATSAAFIITPGPPSAATSEVTAVPGSIPADGSSTSTITVRLRDSFGNPIAGGGNNVLLTTDLGSLDPVSDGGNGIYSASLTSSTTAGTATVTGTVDGARIDDSATVVFSQVGSPPTPSPPPSPANSRISADPVTIPADGSSVSTITVLLIDANGAPLTAGGDRVTLSTTLGALGPVSDRGNGAYTATLRSTTTAGAATVTGTVNGATIGATATVTFAAGSADLEVELSVSDDSPTVGENVAYVVTVRNGGPATATGVQLTQRIPPRLALTSATTSRGSYDAATGVWSVGSLTPDERATLTLVLTVAGGGSN
ncbi:MAG: invasin domain 3-containing protein [Gemmatimonadota bacterium]